ncbi:MAG: tRNA pseudouridine(38-40) synthase TruA [Bacteroidetes bacterium]|nr:MAG: tRNA pseudouridine(38-40) synthase TruA [Bacteroidota bacterium]
MSKRYFIELAYNGRNFHGWQIQPNAITVQETLQDALKILLKQKIDVIGCGRTDTGVHARQFFAHMELDLDTIEISADQLTYKLNRLLNNDIAIFRIFIVNDAAHTRFEALSRTYEYRLRMDKYPFDQEFTYRSTYPKLDFELMNKAAALLFNYTDFTSFSKTGTDVKTNNCKIMQADWKNVDGVWIFTIKADRFLRNMVRAIVGTLLEVGSGKIDLNNFTQIIESKNRGNAGWSVPAHGLALIKLEYPDWIYSV